MTHNIIQFSDKYFIQKCGTAMGTPPAPKYATLYFAIHELKILRCYKQNIRFYKRYINNIFAFWRPYGTREENKSQWN